MLKFMCAIILLIISIAYNMAIVLAPGQAFTFSNIRQETGYTWSVSVSPPEFSLLTSYFYQIATDTPDKTESRLICYENGKALGPAHANHDEIQNIGKGRYSHWYRRILFSTSDNSDPKNNGRIYTARFAYTAKAWVYWVAGGSLLLGIALLFIDRVKLLFGRKAKSV